ncbi:MAG: HNH endonuclease [Pseudomonadales bacterium]|nr:HNH endonuclease [Pseudomonadales bacterium]
MGKIITALFVSLCLLPITYSDAQTHAGRVDKNGGHKDKNTGEYHCHNEPCFTIHKQSSDAVDEAIEEGREVVLLYNRHDWKHWSDFDKDCMNTRHEILNDQAVKGSQKYSPDGCYVSRGEWHDPFSGKVITRASDLDVDHVIPLKWAHTHGGATWSAEKKEQFANDPDNLLAVDDGLNQQKGAKGPTEWMPPNHGYRCDYLRHWQSVLAKYSSLKMTAKENRIYQKQLKACKI